MWCLMVLNVIALIQSAQGGYEYPKPSIPFELPYRGGLQEEILKENKIDQHTSAYSLSYDNYQNLQQRKNEESSHRIVGTDGSVQHNIEIGIKQVQPHIFSNQLNTNINAAVSINNGVSHNSAVRESDSIGIQPGLSSNYPQLVLNIKNKVPPLVNLLSSEYIHNVQENSGVNNLDIQNVESVLDQKNNIPPLVKLNINQISSINENALSQSINLAGVEQQQLSDYSSDFHQSPQQNVNNVIETIVSPVINLEESVPQVLNSQNNVQTTGFSGVLNIDEQVSNNQVNQILLPNSNYEQAQILNIQSSQAGQNGELNLQNNQQNIVSPVITKSITFHVPPPDIEETSVIPAVLPKKIYKIIFIKAPTYDYEYNQQLQAALYSRLAPVEDKTIIYVLTKKPELLSEQGILSQPTKVSEHEVFYVKYKGDQLIDSEREGINESISQLPLNSSGDAHIEPRVTGDH